MDSSPVQANKGPIGHTCTPNAREWALAGPPLGPGFVSTAFKLRLFKTEASAYWEDFVQALEAEEEVEGLDIDASSLGLPTMREETRQFIEARIEEERLKAAEQPGKEPDEQAQQPEPRAEQEAEEPPPPQPSFTRGRSRGKGRRGRGKGRSTLGTGQRSRSHGTGSKRAGEEEAGTTDRGRGRGGARGKGRITPGSKAAEEQTPLESRPGQAPAGAHEVMAVAGSAEGTASAPAVAGQPYEVPHAAASMGTAEAQHPPSNEQEAAAPVKNGRKPQIPGSATGDGDSSSVQLPGLSQDPAPRRQTRSCTGRLPPPKRGTLSDSTSGSDSSSEPSSEDSSLSDVSDMVRQEGEARQTRNQPAVKQGKGSSGPGPRRKPTARRKPHNIQGIEALQELVAVKSKFGGRNKVIGPLRNRKQPPLPTFAEGVGKEVEERRRKAYRDSAKALRSVREALEIPRLYMTAFQIKADELVAPKRRVVPKAAAREPPLGLDEIIVRVDIREFDILHHTRQELLVPGRQRMTALRDAITCPADRNMKSLGTAVQGAFFYIEGVFYVDTRGSAAGVDYVAPIVEFCRARGIAPPPQVPEAAKAMPKATLDPEEEGQPAGQYRQMNMAHVSWEDIGLRAGPGAANVYCHQGCCEHLLNIKDVRRIHRDDPQHLSAYPLIIQEENWYRRECDICQQSMARRVTYDDKEATATPCFWCEECYVMMHYDEQGKLLYDHKVFRYQSG